MDTGGIFETELALEILENAAETLCEAVLVVEKKENRDGEIVILDRLGAFPFVETRDVLAELCFTTFDPDVNLIELCDARKLELGGNFVELTSLCVEPEDFPVKLEAVFVELEILIVVLEISFIELDALFDVPETLVGELTTFLLEPGTTLLEVEAIFVATDAFVLELVTFLLELESLFVLFELFRVELDEILGALDGFLEVLESTFVDVDARFTELGILLVGIVDLELEIFLVELEDPKLVRLEPRVGFVIRDELEVLLDGLTLLADDAVCFELVSFWLEDPLLEDALLEVDRIVDVVGR